jgi:hypothetical protein
MATAPAPPPNKFYYYSSGVDNGIDPATGQSARSVTRVSGPLRRLAAFAQRPQEHLRCQRDCLSVGKRLACVASVDPTTFTIYFTGDPWAFNQWGPNQRTIKFSPAPTRRGNGI